jgi:TetR/AcrR family transcriptional regulator, transcriptional repressor for nem operon
MRVSKEQAAENRNRILKAAARLMRERGISGVGVDALTEAAGMTHGSLYSQFGSKERLVEEAVAYAIAAKGQEIPEVLSLSEYVSEYLSAAHRSGPGNGCPLTAFCCDVSRQSEGVRERFTAGERGFKAICCLAWREHYAVNHGADQVFCLVALRAGFKHLFQLAYLTSV